MSHPVKHRRSKSDGIIAYLRQQILSGKYQLGERFYSNSSLGREFNISTITAGMIISRLEEEELVNRVPRSGTYIAFESGTSSLDFHSDCCLIVVICMDQNDLMVQEGYYYESISTFERRCFTGCDMS